MPSIIRVLDEQTINKIAAGEVIENTASVVKELVENSLDAGSTDISIEIKAGGRQLIRIQDNGCGMSADDALLCLERHATSKIKEVEDIDSLLTMGFRGEAIPSIASISKFMILTAQKDAAQGTMVLVEGGKIKHVGPAVRDPGTTMEVKALFFNVPVRRKFQRSPQVDAQEVLKVVSGLAMANPGVRFSLVHNETLLLQTMGKRSNCFLDMLRASIEATLGRPFASELIPLSWQDETFTIEGFIGKPSFTKPNRTGQHLFINQRLVSAPLVSHFIKEAYGTMLMGGRYPVFVLHLHLPSSWIDPNLHPQKKEVRLRSESKIKESIYSAMQVLWNEKTQTLRPEERTIVPFISNQKDSIFVEQSMHRALDCEKEKIEEPLSWLRPVHIETFRQEDRPALQMDLLPEMEQVPKLIRLRALATLNGYILAEGDRLYVIDQAAAEAQYIYERWMQGGKGKDGQALLIPYTFDLPPADALLLRQKMEHLSALGIQIKEFDNYMFVVDEVPQVIGNVDVKSFIEHVVSLLNENLGIVDIQEEFNKRLALYAVQAAKQRTQKLSLMEAQVVVDRCSEAGGRVLNFKGKPICVPLQETDFLRFFS